MNEEAYIIIRTPVGTTANINIKEVVKQGTVFRPIMCCTETCKVKNHEKEVKYRYGKINKMPVFMDNIAAACRAKHIKNGITVQEWKR